MKLPRNTARNQIKLHAEKMTLLANILRHRPEEIPHTAGRLQNIAVGKAHVGKTRIYYGNDGRVGIEGIKNRCTGGGKLLICQKALQ